MILLEYLNFLDLYIYMLGGFTVQFFYLDFKVVFNFDFSYSCDGANRVSSFFRFHFEKASSLSHNLKIKVNNSYMFSE